MNIRVGGNRPARGYQFNSNVEDALRLRAVVRGLVLCPRVCRCFRGVYAANFPGRVARVPLPPAGGGGGGVVSVSRRGGIYIPLYILPYLSLSYKW